MNELNSTLPPVTPPIPPVGAPPRIPAPAPGDDPSDREPIDGMLGTVESILRQPRRVMYAFGQPGAWRAIAVLIGVAIVCALVYGLVVGTFSRGDQLWIAPVKIALGLFISTLICLPSLYIFGCLGGSQARLTEMVGLVSGLLALMTLLLLGFAPVAWLFSESTQSLCWMGALHLAFWAIATAFGLRFLAAGFKATKARSSAGLAVWSIIFVLVMLQMTTALRPILGTADGLLPVEKKFFLKHWMNCASPARNTLNVEGAGSSSPKVH